MYEDATAKYRIYVGPQIGMNPKPILGLPDLETDLGSPVLIWGLLF